MSVRNLRIFYLIILIVLGSPATVRGQFVDSLLNLVNNNLIANDTDRYDILCKIVQTSPPVDSSIKYCDRAAELAEKLHLNPARLYYNLGYGYLDAGEHALALECFIKAASYYRESGREKSLASSYMAIAETYNKQDNHANEKYYLRNAIEIYKKTNDTINLANALCNLGYADYSMEIYDTALMLFSSTKDIFLKRNDSINYAYCIGNTGLVYSRLSEYVKAKRNLLQAIDLLSKEGDERPVVEFRIEYAKILLSERSIKKSFNLAKSAFNSAVKGGFKDYEIDAARLLAQIYSIMERYDSAFYYQSLYISAKDSLESASTIRKMADMRTEYEVAKKQSEVELLKKNRFFAYIVIIGLIVLILVIYLSLKRSRKLSAALDERRVLLEKQSDELKEKNERIILANEELLELYEITNKQKEEIISSINYAQRIQQAILPPETYITELINENFIFYQPKEIVSGDFYWIKQINQKIVLVAGDCTGHGVPGALMSMLGIGFLNEIVQNMKEIKANQILNELRREIKHSLRQTGKREESREGIDMVLCVIDPTTSTMQFSGAFNPLYIISNINGKPLLKEIKADMMPVGVHHISEKSFTNHDISMEIGDTFYIFTDGIIDQVGGQKNTRFGSKNFQNLLLKICEQPLFEQREIIEKTFNEWRGSQSQRDDILVIGARL